MQKKTKVNVYKAIFCPILTYSCESWVLTKDIRSRIQAAKMNCLRRIKAITRRDRVKNEVVRQQLKVEPRLKKKHKQQLKWFGHLIRMNNNSIAKKVWRARRIRKRKRGCPKKTLDNSKNVTWNEASKKMRNKKERAKF